MEVRLNFPFFFKIEEHLGFPFSFKIEEHLEQREEHLDFLFFLK